jgi:hypothetical protein
VRKSTLGRLRVLSPGKPVSGPTKTHLSRRNRAFLRYAKEGLTARLNGDRRRAGQKPWRNDEPQRDAGRTGSTGPHRSARRAIVAECSYAQTRLTSLRNTPGMYLTRGN